MSAATKLPVLMTVAEFLAWNPGDGQPWQLVDGEPQAMAPGGRTHGALQGELTRLLGNHFVETGRPCSAITEPGIVPHVNAGHNYRVPDLTVTCAGYEIEEYAVSDPVLIVEIMSPSNRKETWANVWTYTSIPSVQEILVLHSTAIAADLLRRLPDGSWPKQPQSIAGGDLTLASVGFRCKLSALYRTTRLAQPDA